MIPDQINSPREGVMLAAGRPAPQQGPALVHDFSGVLHLFNEMDDQLAAKIPRPVGYKVLIAMPTLSRKTSGGIMIPEYTAGREEVAVPLAMVIELGSDAYADKKRFPNGPLCSRGDFILMRSFAGTRVKVRDVEFRIINDDCVEAVVTDPSEVQRA